MRTPEQINHILAYQRQQAAYAAGYAAQDGGHIRWHELPMIKIVLTYEPAHEPIYQVKREEKSVNDPSTICIAGGLVLLFLGVLAWGMIGMSRAEWTEWERRQR